MATQAQPKTERATAAPGVGRMYELDLARFIAAAGVVAFHYLFLGPIVGVTDDPLSPFAHIAQYGFLGVDFFFILSGFVIMMSASNRSASSFTRARIVRIYPIFWVCVPLTAAVRLLDTDVSLARLFANMTMVPNSFGEGVLDGSYWSLAVELQFYALVAVALRLGLLSQIDRVLLGWISYSALRAVIETPDVLDSVLLTAHAHYFVAGAVLYQVHRDRRIDAIRVVTLAASVMLALSWVGPRVRHLEDQTGHLVSAEVSRGLVLFFFAIMATVAWRGLPRLRLPGFAALGAASYPLYLLHQEIGFAVFRVWGWSTVGMAAFTGLGMVLAAHLLAQHVEPRVGAVFRRLMGST
jgi:peptidoglycan/LPS O-acetylase OafA/YrhL